MGEMVDRTASSLREELKKIGYGIGTINAGQLADVLARAAIEAILPKDVMNATTVSCSGLDITIACNDHDTKDVIFEALASRI